jgi:hypothetical protein
LEKSWFVEGDWEWGKEREEAKEVKRGEGKGCLANSSCQGAAGSIYLKNTILPQQPTALLQGMDKREL